MSTSYTYKKIAFNNAQQFKESFYEPEPTTIGYVFIGNHLAWANEDSPDDVTDSTVNEKKIWDNMYAAKKITGSELELVVPKITWTGSTKYRQFDDTIELTTLLSSNTTQNLKPMYVMNSEYNVYKCLANNVSANSTIEPTGKNLTANGIILTADNFLWKYLYNVKPSNRFSTADWLPAPISTSILDYDVSSTTVVDGELTTIVVTNAGSGYVHSNITMPSFVTGCTTLFVSNTVNISANMAISGNGFSTGTYINSIDTVNNKITISSATTANAGGAANTVFVKTRVYINGDGTGAIATPTLSGNTISKIDITSYGKNYTVSNVFVYGTGTGATARAVLGPKFGHGYNSAKELGASNVMISMRIGQIDTTESGLISANTTFRQYGLLRDPYKYGQSVQANTATANSVISQTTNLLLVSGTAYVLNELVYQGTDYANSSFSGYVNDYTTNEVRLTKVKGTISIGSPLKGTSTNPTGRTVISITTPEFQPYTGDILYVQNTTSTQRIQGQSENLKFVVKF